jgi:choline dehydrogenase
MSENMLEPKAAKNTQFHSTGGPISVEYAGFETKSADVFLDAVQYLGYKLNNDFNGEEQLGFGRFHMTTRRGSRESTAKAFLRAAKSRPNLTILLHSRVEQILINSGRAKGVRLKRFGKLFNVNAKTEVILCAGAIVSPQILMLSGIGPKSHLEHHRIKVKVDLPVGKNMQSHVGISETTFLVKEPITFRPLLYAANPYGYWQYLTTGRGPLSAPSGFENLGFIRSGMTNRTAPDILFHHLSLHFGSDLGLLYADALNLNQDQVNASVFSTYVQ